MLGVFARRALCLTAVAAFVAPLSTSCRTSGFREGIYTSPDNDGARHQNVFYTDSDKIYVIVKYANGRQDLTIRVKIKVLNLYGDNVDYPVFLLADTNVKPTNNSAGVLSVQLPDPPPVQRFNPADPQNPLTITPPRATGKFRFIVDLGDEEDQVDFVVLQGVGNIKSPDPNVPTPGNCQPDTVDKCPPAPADKLHSIVCCNADKSCGYGPDGTGLCYTEAQR